MKEIIKKQLEKAPKRKDDEKTRMAQIIGLMQPINIDLTFSLHKVIIEVTRVYVRKRNHFTTFVNATSIENCFSMPTFYIGFCHYQLHQSDSY